MVGGIELHHLLLAVAGDRDRPLPGMDVERGAHHFDFASAFLTFGGREGCHRLLVFVAVKNEFTGGGLVITACGPTAGGRIGGMFSLGSLTL